MKQIEITKDMIREVEAKVPSTRKGAMDPEWLTHVLAHLSGGAKVATVELTDVVQAMAAKVLIAVTFEGMPDKVYRLCIKGFLDHDLENMTSDPTTMRESDFYAQVAPQLTMRTPPCAALVTDRSAGQCVLIMADMIAQGVHFYDALEPLTVTQVEESLDQLAQLHARPDLLEGKDWIPCRLNDILTADFITWEEIQALMHGDRRADLPEDTLSAPLLKKGMEALAELGKTLPETILHGDVHPGNLYRTAEGRLGFTDWQLVHRGHWSLDVAYHINSVLPVEVAENSERELVNHYLDALQRHGGDAPSAEKGWEQYRRSTIYGYYHWAITQRVKPAICNEAFRRLGKAVTRHQSYKLLGLQS